MSRHITSAETSVEEVHNIVLSALEQEAEGEIELGLKGKTRLLEGKG